MILTDFLPQFYQGRVCKYATWPIVNQGRWGTFWSDDPGTITCFLCHFLFNCLSYHSVNFAVIMANVGKRKAFSIGAKHGVNAFSQNEIEHLNVVTTMSLHLEK
ncbi:hypothetical protein AVEN_177276-1 [Araneus ventricosus]|uniref:Uncharacterized protein n=1 Tax=Araneus ventricosus TaxID=182803 RepID=A0A4Y2L6F5_ARAVE|nr:hypothetical protein AVEN_177276-1 [Araneus ventricosus]